MIESVHAVVVVDGARRNQRYEMESTDGIKAKKTQFIASWMHWL